MTFIDIVIIGACSFFHLSGNAAINPHADLSPRLMKRLNLKTDDMVKIHVKLLERK